MKLGKHKTKKDAVNAALEEYIRRQRQLKILDHFGTVDYDPAFDHRAWRGKLAKVR